MSKTPSFEERSSAERGLISLCHRKKMAYGRLQDREERLWRATCVALYKNDDAIIKCATERNAPIEIELPTTIDEYTNKKGFTSLAHYNANGSYIGSVKKLGDKPILARTWVEFAVFASGFTCQWNSLESKEVVTFKYNPKK